MYRLLGKLVALMFNLDEIEKERQQLAERLSLLPDDHCELKMFSSRKRLMDNAYEFYGASGRVEKLSEEVSGCMSIDTSKVGDLEQGLRQLEELRMLYHAHPDDATVREGLAKGLVNAHFDAGEEGDREQSQSLLEELRILYHTHPDDAPVRKQLAMGLFNAHFDARKEGDREQSQSLLEELRILYHTHPDDAPVREGLARGLVNAHVDAGEEGDREQSQSLLEELRTLYHTHPD
ncbi:MAG: hypothetical protein HGB17_03925, partial [Syntrophobacteraceae bacterium]|nr:hypothetical protein [Syntrophobacteraceae bacterium]